MEEFAKNETAQSARDETEPADVSGYNNRAEFMGTVCSVPEVNDVGTGKVTKVRIAVSESAYNKDGSPVIDSESGMQMRNSEFIEVQGWGRLGDRLAEMAKPYSEYKAAREAGDENAKAPRLIVNGELKQETWEKDGKQNSKVVLHAINLDRIENAKGHCVNRVVLKGNLVRDPETKDFANGGKVAKNSIAVNKEYTKKNGEHVKEVSYFNLDAFGSVADSMKSLNKGDFIQIDGKLRMDTFERDGKTINTLKVVPLRVNTISRSKEREAARKPFAPKQRANEKSDGYSR